MPDIFKDIPFLDGDGKIPAQFIAGSTVTVTKTNLTPATGFGVPTWGTAPESILIGTDRHLIGHIQRGSADIVANAVLVSGATLTAGKKVVAVSETGAVLLRTTATAIEVAEILSGAAPEWVSLDGVIV